MNAIYFIKNNLNFRVTYSETNCYNSNINV